jgi:prophage regulatory protein
MIERLKSRLDLRVIRMRELTEMIGASEWTIRRWRQQGEFPAPVRLGERNVGWLLSDIREWLSQRKGG